MAVAKRGVRGEKCGEPIFLVMGALEIGRPSRKATPVAIQRVAPSLADQWQQSQASFPHALLQMSLNTKSECATGQ